MQKRKGISLIVLVITIIVMIVLAGAIILSLNNAGIIEKANQAVKDTDEATVKELAQMAWAEAYADGVRHVEDKQNLDGTNVKGLQERVTDSLKANVANIDDYIITVTESGVDVKVGWKQDGLKVRRGKEELTIGQRINYDETNGGKVSVEKDVSWKVLGADEAGNLLIMSAEDIKVDYRLGASGLAEAQMEWLRGGINKLNAICEPYGKGYGAISARSINVEDINVVTKYIPEKLLYGKGTVGQYGNVVTYYYTGSLYPDYTSSATGEVIGTLSSEHIKGFSWYDGKEFKQISATDLIAETNKGKKITAITSNYYYYTGISTGKLTENTEAYKMIFGTSNGYNKYWLASQYIAANNDLISFGIRLVDSGSVRGLARLWDTLGGTYYYAGGVRAVVTLSSDITFTDS